MAIVATPKVVNSVRLSGNVNVAFVTLTVSGNYATSGEDVLAALKAGIAGFNSSKDPIFLFGTTDTGYTARLESTGFLTLWDGKTQMGNAAPYDAATVDVVVFFEKY